VETIGSKRSYALIWCMPNNDDDDAEIYFDAQAWLYVSVNVQYGVVGYCMSSVLTYVFQHPSV